MVGAGQHFTRRFVGTGRVDVAAWRREIMAKLWVVLSMLPASRSARLSAALAHLGPRPLCTDTLPPGHHFVYNNLELEQLGLSLDGYELYQAPRLSSGAEAYRRRLWVGGRIDWHGAMLFGRETVCVERVLAVRALGANTVVEITRVFSQGGTTRLTERRTLFYTNKMAEGEVLTPVCLSTGFLLVDPTTLFRYSALSNNAHRIHYDQQYAASEGHPTTLVHGPLLVTLMLHHLKTTPGSFTYRNHLPVYCGAPFVLTATESSATVSSASGTHATGRALTNQDVH